MSLSRHHEERRGAGVLYLAGHLGADGIARFTGAVDWVLARSGGPVVLDAGGLLGWSPEGEAAVLELARRVSGRPRPPALCGAGALPVRSLTADPLVPLAVHAGPDTGLDALG